MPRAAAARTLPSPQLPPGAAATRMLRSSLAPAAAGHAQHPSIAAAATVTAAHPRLRVRPPARGMARARPEAPARPQSPSALLTERGFRAALIAVGSPPPGAPRGMWSALPPHPPPTHPPPPRACGTGPHAAPHQALRRVATMHFDLGRPPSPIMRFDDPSQPSDFGCRRASFPRARQSTRRRVACPRRWHRSSPVYGRV